MSQEVLERLMAGPPEPDDIGGDGDVSADVGEAQTELNAWLGAQEDALRERGIII